MVSVIFIKPRGSEAPVDGTAGDSLMQTAVNNGIDELLADCGGAWSCATCHVHVLPEWMERVGQPSADEVAMLEMAVDPDAYSRLSCQIRLDDTLEGLTVKLPKSQL
jgi:2Fe-2S ferredoxin